MLTKCSFRWGSEIRGLQEIFRNSFTIGLSLAPANTSTLSYQDDEGNYYTAIIKRGKLCLNKYPTFQLLILLLILNLYSLLD